MTLDEAERLINRFNNASHNLERIGNMIRPIGLLEATDRYNETKKALLDALMKADA